MYEFTVDVPKTPKGLEVFNLQMKNNANLFPSMLNVEKFMKCSIYEIWGKKVLKELNSYVLSVEDLNYFNQWEYIQERQKEILFINQISDFLKMGDFLGEHGDDIQSPNFKTLILNDIFNKLKLPYFVEISDNHVVSLFQFKVNTF